MQVTKVMIGMPSQAMVCIETMASLIHAINIPNVAFSLGFQKGTYLHDMRNIIIENAVRENCDYVMFVDSDMTFPPHAIKQLLSYKKDVVGGAYNMKQLPPVSTIKLLDLDGKMKKTTGGYIPTNNIFRVFAVPTGFMLIRTQAIKNIKHPFDYDRNEQGELIGDDVNFCKRCNEAGIEVWCDPTLKIGHIGHYLY